MMYLAGFVGGKPTLEERPDSPNLHTGPDFFASPRKAEALSWLVGKAAEYTAEQSRLFVRAEAQLNDLARQYNQAIEDEANDSA